MSKYNVLVIFKLIFCPAANKKVNIEGNERNTQHGTNGNKKETKRSKNRTN